MSSAADRIRESALKIRAAADADNDNSKDPAPTSNTTKRDAREQPTSTDRSPTEPERRRTETAGGGPVFAPRQKPIRRTVDLAPDMHDELDTWQRKTAREIGRARVTGQDVVTSLIAELLTNDDLGRAIRDRIYRAG